MTGETGGDAEADGVGPVSRGVGLGGYVRGTERDCLAVNTVLQLGSSATMLYSGIHVAAAMLRYPRLSVARRR